MLELSHLDGLRNILEQNSKNSGSCIEWTGKTNKNGYGHFRAFKKSWSPHRASFLVNYGEIPDGLYICHKCNNKKCINPSHIYAGTAKDNTNDYINSKDYYDNIKKITEIRKRNYLRKQEKLKLLKNEFCSIKEFASLLKVHENTIRRAIKSGRIGGFKVGMGKCSVYRIPRSEINRIALFNLVHMIGKTLDGKNKD